jgi:hypothetical protein
LPATLTDLQLQVNSASYSRFDIFALPLARLFQPELFVLPSGLRTLRALPAFNDPEELRKVRLPPSLTCLHTDNYFRGPLSALSLPSYLEELHLNCWFDRNLTGVNFPPTLHTLTLAGCQPTDIRKFGWVLPLSQLCFPSSLRVLVLDGFNQPIPSEFHWPPTLEELRFGPNFVQSLDQWTPPPALRILSLATSFRWNQPLAQQRLPASLLRLELPDSFEGGMQEWQWPSQLQTLLLLHGESSFDAQIPPSLRSLHLRLSSPCLPLLLLAQRVPATLRHLCVESVLFDRLEVSKRLLTAQLQEKLPFQCSLSVVDLCQPDF